MQIDRSMSMMESMGLDRASTTHIKPLNHTLSNGMVRIVHMGIEGVDR